ncbi:hypothetical protein MPV89_001001 [Vibrio vulnificus]|nr:hypothetical protein [Vibrio vulnificus]EIZ4666881.1 hypothetical protein [Vibrio vulnificus]
MEEQVQDGVYETSVSRGSIITEKLKKSRRTCLVFPERILSIVTVGDTDEVEGYTLDTNLIYKEKLFRASSVGNSLFLENLSSSNTSSPLVKLYVVLESTTVGVSTFIDGSYASSDHLIRRVAFN